MPYVLEVPRPEKPTTYVVYDKVLTADTCKDIIGFSKRLEAEKGKASSSKNKRDSTIWWIHHQPGIDSLFKNLAHTVLDANKIFWNFHLTGFMEPLQLTHYKTGGHYGWHEDRSDVGITVNRKLSGTIVLNEDYEGGELELFETQSMGKLALGSLVLFPSFKGHRVLPVTKGERWSLVFWVTGPPFQ